MAQRGALQPGVVVSVVGPTASGKTELAIALAQTLGTEIVNADARQVFRGMPIGTPNPLRRSAPLPPIIPTSLSTRYHVMPARSKMRA